MKLKQAVSFDQGADIASIKATMEGKLKSTSAQKPFDADHVRLYFVEDHGFPFAVFDDVPGDLLVTMFYANQVPGAQIFSTSVNVAAFDKNECLGVWRFPTVLIIWATILLAKYSIMDMTDFRAPAVDALRQKLQDGKYPPHPQCPAD